MKRGLLSRLILAWLGFYQYDLRQKSYRSSKAQFSKEAGELPKFKSLKYLFQFLQTTSLLVARSGD